MNAQNENRDLARLVSLAFAVLRLFSQPLQLRDRGLPKHLKLYAVPDTFQLLFGVTVPDVPQDATRKLVPGTWLKFLSDTASAG